MKMNILVFAVVLLVSTGCLSQKESESQIEFKPEIISIASVNGTDIALMRIHFPLTKTQCTWEIKEIRLINLKLTENFLPILIAKWGEKEMEIH